jgi:hypothetical protein
MMALIARANAKPPNYAPRYTATFDSDLRTAALPGAGIWPEAVYDGSYSIGGSASSGIGKCFRLSVSKAGLW